MDFMKLSLKKNRGFTLTELIVVIAIIGILAAVLIPGITRYIRSARRSNDEQVAGAMTRDLEAYCTEYELNQNSLLGTDIRTILMLSGHDLKPRTDGWVFVYNKEAKQVRVVDINEAGALVYAAAVEQNPSDPTNIEVGTYLISKGETDLEVAINLLCNLSHKEDFLNGISASMQDSVYLTVLNQFNPDNTLFISNNEVYTTVPGTGNITKIVTTDLTMNAPKIKNDIWAKVDSSAKTNVSKIMKTVEGDSPLALVYPTAKTIDETTLGVIDLKDFAEYRDNSFIYNVKMGAYVVGSTVQEFSDVILSVNYELKTKDNGEKVDSYTVLRKFIVSYYNENGLYARGETKYSTYTEYTHVDKPQES